MNKKEIKLAKNLSRLAKEKNLSISTIAYKVGMSKSSLHSYFIGVEPKSVIALKKVADFFGVSLDELIFDERNKKEPSEELSLDKYSLEITVKKI